MELKRGQHQKLYGDNQKQLTGYWPDVNVKTQSQHYLVLTRGAHRGCGRGTTVDTEPQWLRGSWWQGLGCGTWGSREGSRGSLSLWGCQGCAERGAGLWCLSTCQSCQSPSANLEWIYHQIYILTGDNFIVQPYLIWTCIMTKLLKWYRPLID